MVQQAIDTFGGLDILVNNAGFVRDRMLVNTSEEEWDAVIRVHLKGHFAPLRHAGAYWRAEAKEGRQRAARVINTSSGAGLQGSVGQATYSAAKAGIAGLTLVAAQELGRYGVTVNAIAPVARTRMTEGAFDTSAMALPEDNSPIVAWLASEEAGDVTGRVIEIEGGKITVENGWAHGPSRDAGRRWDAAEVGPGAARAARRGADPGAGLRRLRTSFTGPCGERLAARLRRRWLLAVLVGVQRARPRRRSRRTTSRPPTSAPTPTPRQRLRHGRAGATSGFDPESARRGWPPRTPSDAGLDLLPRRARRTGRRASGTGTAARADELAGGLLGDEVGHQHPGRHRRGRGRPRRRATRPSTYIPEWRGTPSEAGDGPQPAEQRQRPRTGATESDYRRLLQARDRTCVRRGARARQRPPGAVWAYNNAAIQTLDRVIRNATGDGHGGLRPGAAVRPARHDAAPG